MSGKLDQSLDDILSTRRKTTRQTRNRGGKSGKSTGAPAAPVGGIKKSTKQMKPTAKGVSAPAPTSRESKIVVSGLPTDVNEGQIKEYFQKSVGAVKRVIITYNQHGVSRGIAQIYFGKSDAAAKAAKDLNGMLVDKRPMKIELVMDADQAPPPRAVKSLGERVAYAPGRKPGKFGPLTKTSANPKAQPKSAAVTKANAANGRGGRAAGRGRGRGGRQGRNAARPKKTAEELDAEMTDYMTGGGGAAAETNGGTAAAAPAAATGEDLGMDEISVSSLDFIL